MTTRRRSIRETLKARGAHGFHHWAIGAPDFDAAVARHKALGYAEAFSDISPRGVRVVYFDTTRDLPGMLEIIEMTADAEEQYRHDLSGSEGMGRRNLHRAPLAAQETRRICGQSLEHDPEKVDTGFPKSHAPPKI